MVNNTVTMYRSEKRTASPSFFVDYLSTPGKANIVITDEDSAEKP